MKKLTANGPDYLKTFKCIGASCIDNCCIGWDVDFDQKAYVKYKTIKSPLLAPIIAHNVTIKKHPFDVDMDYAGVRLKKGKRCPFLDADNWCQIQKEMGEDYLSNVCWHFPRYLNKIGDRYELSATLSCPVVAEMLLDSGSCLTFTNHTLNPSRILVTYDLSNAPLQKLKDFEAAREKVLAILTEHEKPLEERLYRLDPIGTNSVDGKGSFEKVTASLLRWIHLLNPSDPALSARYLGYTKVILRGLSLKRTHQKWALDWQKVNEGLKNHVIPFAKRHPEVLSNYMVHYYFKTLYPYSEHIKIKQLYDLSMALYTLILIHLAGLGQGRGDLQKADVIQFLSAFTKAVEHHHTFFDQLAHELQRQPVDKWYGPEEWTTGLDHMTQSCS